MRLEYFQMIDRVEVIDLEAATIVARADVPQNSTIFEGHFPGYPIMPGVLLIETMAQASGWLILAKSGFQRMPFLAQVERAKLRSFVPPQTTMTIDAKLTHEGSGYAVTEARISAAGKPVADAELRFRTLPFPSPDLEAVMRGVATRVGVDWPAP